MQYHYSRPIEELYMQYKLEEPMRCCRFYTTEDENLDFYHDRNADDGFCLIRDFFSSCIGCSCKDYEYDNLNTSSGCKEIKA